VWSVDNELAKKEKKGRVRSKKVVKRNKGKKSGRVVVTSAMLMEVETVLQTQVMFFLLILNLIMYIMLTMYIGFLESINSNE